MCKLGETRIGGVEVGGWEVECWQGSSSQVEKGGSCLTFVDWREYINGVSIFFLVGLGRVNGTGIVGCGLWLFWIRPGMKGRIWFVCLGVYLVCNISQRPIL